MITAFFYAIINFMKLNLEINNTTKSPIRKKLLEEAVKKTLKAGGLDFLARKYISLSIAIVGAREIKRLNKIYRKVDAATDVLSFAEYKNAEAIKRAGDNRLRQPADGGVFLGELILCYTDIREYARKNKIGLAKELANAVSHGVLHLLGMKHGKKMFEIQERVAHST